MVVVCWDQRAGELPKWNLGCSHAIFWEQCVEVPSGLLWRHATKAILREDWEDDEEQERYEQAEAWQAMPAQKPPTPPEPAGSPEAPLIDDATRERVWFAQSGDSHTRAALKQEALLDVDVGHVPASGGAVPTSASELLTPSLPVGWPDKVPNGRGRLVQRGSKEQGTCEGMWIQMRLCETEEPAQRRPYCLLCEAWADEGHTTTRRHLQSKRDVAGGPTADEHGENLCIMNQMCCRSPRCTP